MAKQSLAPESHPRRRAKSIPLPDCVALVLQGGGALGSYQAGVVQGLMGQDIEIDWVAGISIGAINAAIVAGNPPEQRVARLQQFWDRVTSGLPSFPIFPNDRVREFFHELSAGTVLATGVPGFFKPRLLPPAMALPGTMEALSYYDTRPLRDTLDSLIDWDLVNNGPVRLSVGAVDIESGNFRYFDSSEEKLDARHVMASGALPPGLPPVEIDGRYYWDGGLVSNTPLSHVLDHQYGPTLVFQIDLFPAASEAPHTMADVMAREKEIRFSSRTRQISAQVIKLRKERELIRKALAKLPKDLCDDPDIKALAACAEEHAVSLVHLVYRANAWEGGSSDFEFSARTMNEHWTSGLNALEQAMGSCQLVAENIETGTTEAFDLSPKAPPLHHLSNA